MSKAGLKKDTVRTFELDKIGFDYPVVQCKKKAFLRKAKWLNPKDIYVDFRKQHDELLLQNTDNDVFFLGWGDFNIVKEIIPEIRQKFIPQFEIKSDFQETSKKILSENSVAIHFRRTDFLNPKIGSFGIGLCTDEYYRNAINFIKEKTDNPYFVIFSDDIDYIKSHFEIENSFFVNGNKGYEDLFLMSLCNHFITANSTFSFWGAMLNKNEDKIVCIPEYWYNAPLRQADYIPDQWIRISIK